MMKLLGREIYLSALVIADDLNDGRVDRIDDDNTFRVFFNEDIPYSQWFKADSGDAAYSDDRFLKVGWANDDNSLKEEVLVGGVWYDLDDLVHRTRASLLVVSKEIYLNISQNYNTKAYATLEEARACSNANDIVVGAKYTYNPEVI